MQSGYQADRPASTIHGMARILGLQRSDLPSSRSRELKQENPPLPWTHGLVPSSAWVVEQILAILPGSRSEVGRCETTTLRSIDRSVVVRASYTANLHRERPVSTGVRRSI